MEPGTEQIALYDEAILVFSEDVTFTGVWPSGDTSREVPGRLILAKFSPTIFVVMVFTRTGRVASGTPFCTNIVTDDTVFEFSEPVPTLIHASVPQKNSRARIVIDEGRALHGVAIGNTLEIRFPRATVMWQFCSLILEVKLCLADHRTRLDALLDSVIAENYGEVMYRLRVSRIVSKSRMDDYLYAALECDMFDVNSRKEAEYKRRDRLWLIASRQAALLAFAFFDVRRRPPPILESCPGLAKVLSRIDGPGESLFALFASTRAAASSHLPIVPYNPFLPYQSLSPPFVYSAKSADVPTLDSCKNRHRTRHQPDVGAYGIPKRSRRPCVAGRDALGRFDGRAEPYSEELSSCRKTRWASPTLSADGVGIGGMVSTILHPDHPTPSALFVRRLMLYCSVEVDAANEGQRCARFGSSVSMDDVGSSIVSFPDSDSHSEADVDLCAESEDSLEDLEDGLESGRSVHFLRQFSATSGGHLSDNPRSGTRISWIVSSLADIAPNLGLPSRSLLLLPQEQSLPPYPKSRYNRRVPDSSSAATSLPRSPHQQDVLLRRDRSIILSIRTKDQNACVVQQAFCPVRYKSVSRKLAKDGAYVQYIRPRGNLENNFTRNYDQGGVDEGVDDRGDGPSVSDLHRPRSRVEVSGLYIDLPVFNSPAADPFYPEKETATVHKLEAREVSSSR
ncbi:hypothetical protein GSI_04252 [Ganoderma sinense ZZ0214-1]|uniref:Uncharacterized protein n=1 Tax=Ganoderma sinense ZZ0214-1 TaxID=1077348 RepID=A0A2G8SIN3_9APHY|nr:hypothetical protein GSI_04252 [Ganoderma sinense ZZ0214-1]